MSAAIGLFTLLIAGLGLGLLALVILAIVTGRYKGQVESESVDVEADGELSDEE